MHCFQDPSCIRMNFSEEALTSLGYACFPPGQNSMKPPTADGWSSSDFLTERDGKMSMSRCCHGSRINSKTWNIAVAKSGEMNLFYGRGDKFCFNLLYSFPSQFKFYLTRVQIGERTHGLS